MSKKKYNIVYDYSKLLGRIKEKYDTIEKLVHKISISMGSLELRLNNSLKFTQQDIKELCEVLEVEKSEIPEYFFKGEVMKT